MNQSQAEAYILDRLMPDLVAEGYDVYLQPQAPLTPAFMEGYVPDAIALRGDVNLAIEIVKDRSASPKLGRIAALFEGRKDWELRLILLNPANADGGPPLQSITVIRTKIAELRELIAEEHLAAALLLGWGILEALTRLRLLSRIDRPQTPGRLIDLLAQDGHILPSQADVLRPLAKARNTLIHGGLDIPLDAAVLIAFAAILDDLCAEPASAD